MQVQLKSRTRHTIFLVASVLILTVLFLSSNTRTRTAQVVTSVYQTDPLPAKLPRVVVSISSFGKRLSNIGATIESLQKQDLTIDTIYVHVPYSINRLHINNTILPDEILALQAKYPNLNVSRPLIDYGSSTKLLGTLMLEDDPSTIIITADDDVEYPPTLAGHLVRGILHNPTKVIPSYHCEWWHPGWPFISWGSVRENRVIGPCPGWQATWAGSAYQRGYFAATALEDPIFDYSAAPAGCKLHDDVWISGVLFRRNIRPFRISFDISQHHHAQYTKESIHSVKNGQRDYRDPCIAHFDYFRV